MVVEKLHNFNIKIVVEKVASNVRKSVNSIHTVQSKALRKKLAYKMSTTVL